MTYNEAMEFIHGTLKFGSKPGLETITELLKRLGNPHKKQKFIHVAGTNGKGSVTKIISSVLKEAGYKVGTYTSPFVYRFEERIEVGGSAIGQEDITQLAERVASACRDMEKSGLPHPTEFEIITAIGLLYFEQEDCDYTVLEVGLGGRLDATNVIEKPLVSVITSISFDHTEWLGNTLSEIAAEKCGIIKDGVPVAVYPAQEASALDVICASAKKKNADVFVAEMPKILKSDISGNCFSYASETYELPLIGTHMALNAATALCAIDILKSAGVKISQSAAEEGMKKVCHGGRLEIIGTSPLFIVDGAHNASGIEALKNAVKEIIKGKNCAFIMGMLRDKEYEKAVADMAPMCQNFISVTVPNPRALEAEELGKLARQYLSDVYVSQSPYDAVKKAVSLSPDVIIAFGSLYLLGDIKNAFFEIMEDRYFNLSQKL